MDNSLSSLSDLSRNEKYLFLFISFTAFSNIKLPSLVSDGMVLQRDVPVHIWGWANPGEKVNILFKGKK